MFHVKHPLTRNLTWHNTAKKGIVAYYATEYATLKNAYFMGIFAKKKRVAYFSDFSAVY